MRRILLLATIFVFVFASAARSLLITPLPQVNIERGERGAVLQLMSDDNTYQAEMFRIEQGKDGEDTMIKTDEVVAYPIIFKAPRAVRIAIKNENIDRSHEHYYRILVRQLRAQKPDSGIQASLAFSIPVFVLPDKANRAFKVVCRDHIEVTNTGNVHVKLLRQDNTPVYVMPGNTITFTDKVKTLKDTDTDKVYCAGGKS